MTIGGMSGLIVGNSTHIDRGLPVAERFGVTSIPTILVSWVARKWRGWTASSPTGTLSPPSTARLREQPKRALDIPLRGKV